MALGSGDWGSSTGTAQQGQLNKGSFGFARMRFGTCCDVLLLPLGTRFRHEQALSVAEKEAYRKATGKGPSVYVDARYRYRY